MFSMTWRQWSVKKVKHALVMTGHGPAHREAATALRTPDFEVRLASAIGDAVRLHISSAAL
jgi:hypothetical protein